MNINKILETKYKFSPKIVKSITKQTQEKIAEKLKELGLKDPSAGQLYQALIYKASESEDELCNYLGRVDCGTEHGMQSLFNEALRLFPPKLGFFLKEKKAKEMIIQKPPKKLMKLLDYQDVDQLLLNEDIYEIYGSLRFVETDKWMHELINNYKTLKRKDFEHRAIKVQVLSKKKWHNAAETFIKKKYHNLTHLKELGVLFALPREASNEVGVILTSFSLILHYFHEISMFSKIFENMKNETEFGEKIIPILKGENKKDGWLIIPRYLAKEKKPPKEMFEPHINPEAIFWKKATKDLIKLGKELPGKSLEFWADLNWIGGYFKGVNNGPRFISFNMPDVSISFANQLPMSKRYTYHYREALWNHIFEIEKGNIEKYFYEQYK